MDKVVKNKKKKFKKYILGGSLLLFIVVFSILSFRKSKVLSLSKNEVLLGNAQEGDFENYVHFNTKVSPKLSFHVNVLEGGSVSEIYAKNGTYVEQGEQLVKINNPSKELIYMTQEATIIEQVNNLMNMRLSIKKQEFDLENQLINIENDFNNAERKYISDTALFRKGIISELEYGTSAQAYKYQLKRSDVIKKSLNLEKNDRKNQLHRIDKSLENMKQSLELLEQNKKNFILLAPVSGYLSGFYPELGKNYNDGENLASIDTENGFQLRGMLDEYYNSKVTIGDKGVVIINNKEYELFLSKIYDKIENGKFQVDLAFNDSIHIDSILKNGMTLKAKVFLSESRSSVLIPKKGDFYQETGGTWIFVRTGDTFERRNIEIGRENSIYYEVIKGLKEGEELLLDGYSNYADIERIELN